MKDGEVGMQRAEGRDDAYLVGERCENLVAYHRQPEFMKGLERAIDYLAGRVMRRDDQHGAGAVIHMFDQRALVDRPAMSFDQAIRTQFDVVYRREEVE